MPQPVTGPGPFLGYPDGWSQVPSRGFPSDWSQVPSQGEPQDRRYLQPGLGYPTTIPATNEVRPDQHLGTTLPTPPSPGQDWGTLRQDQPWTEYAVVGTPLVFSRRRTFLLKLHVSDQMSKSTENYLIFFQ